MESLIKIEGKPLEKLIEVVSNGIGTLYRPRAIRKEADAEAYKIETIERAKANALAEGRLIEAENLDRINNRVLAKEINRQNNIDDVVEMAANEMKNIESISEQPVNQDWATRLFNIVQDVSDDDMKLLWAKILAGEVKSPNTYSLRTLELLRNMSKTEADLFVKVSPFVLETNDSTFIYRNIIKSETDFGIKFSDVGKLTEAGLIQPGSFTTIEFKSYPDKNKIIPIIYNSYVLLITTEPSTATIRLPIYVLTKTGEELYKLIQVQPNLNYLKEIASEIKNDKTKVAYAFVKSRKDGNVSYEGAISI